MTIALSRLTRTRPSVLTRVSGAIARWWHLYRDWRERRAAILELHALDDRMLKDMGIRRSEIESVVMGGTRDQSRRAR